MNNENLIEQIKHWRETTGCPYWAIRICLIMYEGDENKVSAKLESMYAWYNTMGDNPGLVIKRHEEDLRNEYYELMKSNDHTDRQNVFIFGEKKKDAPPEPQMTREQMEECIKATEQYLRTNND